MMKVDSLNFDSFLEACDSKHIKAEEVCKWAVANNIKFQWHPLGFVMGTLMVDGDRKIRLHLWSNKFNKVQTPSWSVHNHVFDLVSWVLNGSIENTAYTLEGKKTTHQLYSVNYEKSQSILLKTNSFVSLNEVSRSVITNGNLYFVKAGSFHKSKANSKKTTVTVCYTIDSLKEAPLVVGEVGGDSYYSYQRESVTENELREILSDV